MITQKQVESLHRRLAERGTPGRWQWLFRPQKTGGSSPELISTDVRRLQIAGSYANPTLQDAPEAAFVREGARIPVLHDWDIIEAFRDEGCLDDLPCFLCAGERREYRIDPTKAKVGILIAGGLAAGLNMVVDSIVKRHFTLAFQMAGGRPYQLRIYGYDGGYVGMMNGKSCQLAPTERSAVDAGYASDLPIRVTDPQARAEGSTLVRMGRGTEVTDEIAIRQLSGRHAARLIQEGLDILYVLGGNGTLSWAAHICDALGEIRDAKPIAVVGGPKTMDNDVFFTDVTFGFRTAVDQATDFVTAIHADAQGQDRLGLLEVFGAATGWVALHAIYDSGVGDQVLIRERLPLNQQDYKSFLSEILDYVERRLERKGHAVLVVAEGAMPEYKWRDAGAKDQAFASLLGTLKQRYGAAREAARKRPFGISDVRTRYLVRSTPPNTYDIELCKMTGKLMVDTALAGFSGCTVNRWQNDFVLVPLATATERLKEVPTWDFFYQSFLDRVRVEKTGWLRNSLAP